MFNWFKQDKSQSPVEKLHTEDREQKVKEIGVSEPVLAIVKSFKEPNRWSCRIIQNYMSDICILKDSQTDFEICVENDRIYAIYSNGCPLYYKNSPKWMTSKEKKYIEREIYKWYSKARAEVENIVNTTKRNEVKKLYGVED